MMKEQPPQSQPEKLEDFWKNFEVTAGPSLRSLLEKNLRGEISQGEFRKACEDYLDAAMDSAYNISSKENN